MDLYDMCWGMFYSWRMVNILMTESRSWWIIAITCNTKQNEKWSYYCLQLPINVRVESSTQCIPRRSPPAKVPPIHNDATLTLGDESQGKHVSRRVLRSDTTDSVSFLFHFIFQKITQCRLDSGFSYSDSCPNGRAVQNS